MEFTPDIAISMGQYHAILIGFVGLVLLSSTSLRTEAGLNMDLSIQRLSATGWVMEEVNLDLNLESGQQLTVHMTAASLIHDALPGKIEGIRLDCPLQTVQHTYHCHDGRLSISTSPYGPQELRVSGEFIDSERLKLKAQGFKLASGRISVELELKEGSWEMVFKGKDLKLDALRKEFAAKFLPSDSELSGRAQITAQVAGNQSQPEHINMDIRVSKFSYADAEGLHVAEDGRFRLDLKAKRKGSDWVGSSGFILTGGQFYADPFYVEVLEEPLSLQLQGRWKPVAQVVQVDEAMVKVPRVMESRGRIEIDTSKMAILQADIDLQSDNVDSLYRVFLQPMLIGTMADDVEAGGILHSRIGLKNGQLQTLHADLKDVNLDDRRGLFALYDINGSLAWGREKNPAKSHIRIEGGQLYRIDFGALDIHAHAQQGEVALEAPVEIPLMLGFLHIDKLHLLDLLGDAPRWTTSAQFRDISLGALAEAFEWPPMEGTLQGTIPNVRYHQKRLEMDGELVVDVFGGKISVDELLIEEPLGRVPELSANMHLRGLDLARITQTFSFGHIEGGLEGEIADLRLASWEPIAFNARFNTPEKDRTPHRISQRAVDNLTALGNGVGSGLSSTFLGFFKEFRYDRIELQAKLNGNVAELDGMKHPDGGYYIVKGSGLPRIDVIARNRQVAWKTLLERLKSIRVEGMEVR
ncbi:MAG: hypothetical protein K1563_15870 [Candidatus Thiodiazotropha sp. (ex. Lucinisca nassula)]|nr:hypothetical protein [Candidatus Thiodiazotropha sp. (ex. Lucinisca nassula)]